MWFVYILYSKRIDKYYIGITDNLELRLERHNQGWGKFTKGGIPWKLVYSEKFASKQEAMKREKVKGAVSHQLSTFRTICWILDTRFSALAARHSKNTKNEKQVPRNEYLAYFGIHHSMFSVRYSSSRSRLH